MTNPSAMEEPPWMKAEDYRSRKENKAQSGSVVAESGSFCNSAEGKPSRQFLHHYLRWMPAEDNNNRKAEKEAVESNNKYRRHRLRS